MAGLVITIAQRKGGAGKTTLAAQLATAWLRQGARVALLDIDPQASLAAWVELRRARLGAENVGFDFAALPGWRAAQWIEDRARGAEFVVVDGPPHADTEARIAVRAASLVLVPVQPSPLDLWATEATLAMVREERRHFKYFLGALVLALLVYLPNFLWNWAHGFVSYTETGRDANVHGVALHPAAFFAFLGSLFAVARAAKAVAGYALTLRARPGQARRVARLSVSFGAICVRAPAHRGRAAEPVS